MRIAIYARVSTDKQVRLRSVDPPSSIMAADSFSTFSTDCENALPAQRSRIAENTDFATIDDNSWRRPGLVCTE